MPQRYLSASAVSLPARPFVMLPKIKILLLASDPHADDCALRIDREMRAISNAIERSRHRDGFELLSAWAVTIDDLQHVLLKHEPQIVHFSGHGDRSHGILLANTFGDECAVDSRTLGSLFGVLQRFVRVVVLNACETLPVAETLRSVVDYSIGMVEAITDDAATAFAGGFYGALAWGRTIDEAFRLGCNRIDLAGSDEGRTPRLLVREGLDPGGHLIPPPDDEPWVIALERIQRLRGQARSEAYGSLQSHVDGGDPQAISAVRALLLDDLTRAGTQVYPLLEAVAKWLPPRRSEACCTPSNLLALEILPEYAVAGIRDREVAEFEGFAGEYPLLALRGETLRRNASLLVEWLFHPAMPALYGAGEEGAKQAEATRAGLLATWAIILGTSQPRSDGAATPDEVLTALVAEIHEQTSGTRGLEMRVALAAYWEEMRTGYGKLAATLGWFERAARRDLLRRRDMLQMLLARFRALPN